MALSSRFAARLVEPQPVGDALDGLGADPHDLLEVVGAAKRGTPAGSLPIFL